MGDISMSYGRDLRRKGFIDRVLGQIDTLKKERNDAQKLIAASQIARTEAEAQLRTSVTPSDQPGKKVKTEIDINWLSTPDFKSQQSFADLLSSLKNILDTMGFNSKSKSKSERAIYDLVNELSRQVQSGKFNVKEFAALPPLKNANKNRFTEAGALMLMTSVIEFIKHASQVSKDYSELEENYETQSEEFKKTNENLTAQMSMRENMSEGVKFSDINKSTFSSIEKTLRNMSSSNKETEQLAQGASDFLAQSLDDVKQAMSILTESLPEKKRAETQRMLQSFSKDLNNIKLSIDLKMTSLDSATKTLHATIGSAANIAAGVVREITEKELEIQKENGQLTAKELAAHKLQLDETAKRLAEQQATQEQLQEKAAKELDEQKARLESLNEEKQMLEEELNKLKMQSEKKSSKEEQQEAPNLQVYFINDEIENKFSADKIGIVDSFYKQAVSKEKFLKKFGDDPGVTISNIEHLSRKHIIPENKEVEIDTISNKFSQALADDIYAVDGVPALILIFANSTQPGGLGANARAQEEGVLETCNAVYAMPKSYGKGLIDDLGGMYVVDNVTLKANLAKPSVCTLLFQGAPNMMPPSDDSHVSLRSERSVFNGLFGEFDREAYLRHLTTEIIMQFKVAEKTGQRLITGLFGTGVFQNKVEDIAAIYAVVSKAFPEVKVHYALGADRVTPGNTRSNHTIFREPNVQIQAEVKNVFDKIKTDPSIGQDLPIQGLSNDLKTRYNSSPTDRVILDANNQPLNLKIASISVLKSMKDPSDLSIQFSFTSEQEAKSFVNFLNAAGITSKGSGKEKHIFIPEKEGGSYNVILSRPQYQHLFLSQIQFHGVKKNEKLPAQFTQHEIDEMQKYIDKKSTSKDAVDVQKRIAFQMALNLKDKYPRTTILNYMKEEFPILTTAPGMFKTNKAGEIFAKMLGVSEHTLGHVGLFDHKATSSKQEEVKPSKQKVEEPRP